MFARGFAFRSSPAAAGGLLLDGLIAAPAAAFSLRKLRTAYLGSAIRVIRASDSTQQDIGFSGNDLDTSALTTFGSGTDVDILNWYDQTTHSDGGSPAGATRMLTAAAGKRFRIVTAGALLTVPNGKPAGKTTASIQGYSSPTFGTAYTGTTLAASLVAILGTQSYARGIGVTKDNNPDFNAATRAGCILRVGTGANVSGYRNGDLAAFAITNGVLYAMTARFSGTSYIIAHGGGTNSVGSTAAFDVNQMYLGMEDDTGGQAGPSGTFCEAILWFADPGATEAAAVRADQISYWGAT